VLDMAPAARVAKARDSRATEIEIKS
jgi:hypothetical protein